MAAYPVVYCVFDLLEIDGEVLTHQPLEERRARCRGQSAERGPSIRAWQDNAQGRFDDACRSGREGPTSKRADAPYVPGRSRLAEAEMRLGAGVSSAATPTDRQPE